MPDVAAPSTIGSVLTIVRWRARASARWILYGARHTRQGRLAVLLFVVAAPGLFGATVGIPPGSPGSTGPGAGVVALLMGSLCVLSLVPATLARVLVLEEGREPLRAHPALLPGAAGASGASVAFGAATYLTVVLGAIHGRTAASALGSWTSAGATSVLLFGMMVALAAVTTDATRRLLAGGDRRHRATMLRHASIGPFLITFVGLAVLPGILDSRAPTLLERAGLAATSAAELALAAGGLLFLVASGLALALLSPALLVARWRVRSLDSLALVDADPASSVVRLDRPRIPLIGTPMGPWGRARLFLAKDRIQALPAGFLATALPVGLLALGLRAWPTRDAGHFVAGLAVPAVLAFPLLGSLGREGKVGDLLALALGARSLLAHKWTAGVVHVGLGSLVCLAILLFATLGTGRDVAAIPLGAATAAGTMGFSALSIGIGALLPDARQRSLLLPGASRTGILLYILLVAATIGIGASVAGPNTAAAAVPIGTGMIAVGATLGRMAATQRAAEWRP